MGWKNHVSRFEREAVAVMERIGAPSSVDNLSDYQARDELDSNAQLVILGVHWLRKEVGHGRIDRALDRLFSVCDAYERMVLFRDVPSLEKSWAGIPLSKRARTWNLTATLYNILNTGIAAQKTRIKNASLAKKTQRKKSIAAVQAVIADLDKNGNPERGRGKLISMTTKLSQAQVSKIRKSFLS